jgi:hypothetical protein
MEDLELEHAELLPSRETLWSSCHSGHGFGFTQVAYGIGNTNQAGFINLSALNCVLSGNTFVIG